MADTNETAKSPGGLTAATSGVTTGDSGPPGVLPNLLPTADEISNSGTGDIGGAINQTIADCQAAYTASVDAIHNHINECMNECRLGAATCVACILGKIERETGLQESVIAKCWDRIGNGITAAINDSWQKSIAAGVPPPNEAQFQAFLTGNPVPPSESAPLGSTSTPVVDTNQPTPPQQVPLPPGVTLPDGAVLPVQDTTAGQIVCPDSPPPFRSPNSPTGWLGIQYQPVYDGQGHILWCVPITHIANAPTVPDGGTTGIGTGGPPTGDNTTGGNAGGTGSNGTPTVPGSQGGGSDTIGGVVPTCSPGFHVYSQPSFVAPNPGPGWTPLGQSDDGSNILWCIPDADQQTITPPASTITPITIPSGLLACSPADVETIANTLNALSTRTPQEIIDALGPALGVDAGFDAKSPLNWLLHPWQAVTSVITGAAGGIAKLIGDFLGPNSPGMSDLNSFQCSGPTYGSMMVNRALVNFAGGWLGIVPDATRASYDYSINYLCPWKIPATPEMTAAYSRGYFTDAQAAAVWRMNGDCPAWQNELVKVIKNRVGIQDAYRLFKLGKLSDSEFIQSWRRQGIDIDNDFTKWNEALIQYPGFADIIRMMVRDIGDPNTVNELGLDAEFTDKWQGQLKQWGEAQGISDDVAKAFWMAHWQNPSPQQVYEWLHRLRTDDRDPDDPYKTLAIDRDKAASLLQIADYVPGLIDFYIATSYRPLTRVDVRRMYVSGALPDIDSVRRAYRDLGYDALNAGRLANFTEVISRPQKATLAGEIPSKEVQKAYQADLISRTEASALLDQSGLTADQTETYLRVADDRRTIASRKLRTEALKKRYFVGEFDNQAIIFELTNAGVSVEAASRLQVLWQDERAAKAKQPTVGMLCNWYGKGLIDLAEYYRRVRNLNYSEVDAQRVIQICQLGITEHRQKEFEKEQARIAKDEKTRKREALIAEKEARAAARQAKLLHRLEHKEVTKTRDKDVTRTVTDTRTDKPDDNVTEVVQVVQEHKEQPPAP